MKQPSAEGPDPVAVLHDMINGYWRSQVLYAAVRLGVVDALAGGPMRLPELADRAGAQQGALGRLMRALTVLGVCTVNDGVYRLSALGQALQRTAPGGAHVRALLTGELFFPLWTDLLHSVSSGVTAVEHQTGRAPFELLAGSDDLSSLFDRAMAEQTRVEAREVAAASHVPDRAVVVDVGGGSGALLIELLRAHPSTCGILLDLPEVAERGRAELAAAGLSGRATVFGGDFFTDVPAGGDIYLLSFVLHDWDDDRATALLRTVRRAMHPEARLLLVEGLVPESGTGDETTVYYDLHMLVMTGGRERTEAEYAALLANADLRHTSTIATGRRRNVVEARPNRC